MNLTEFLDETNDLLDNDEQARKYPTAMIVRNGDRALRGLFRLLADSNKEWSNFELCLQKEAAVKVFDTEWNYRLPTWITHVVKVYQRDQTATSETTLSPYLWTTIGTVVKGRTILKHVVDGRPHWKWDGNHTLRLSKFSEALELVIECVTRPPHMLKGKIATIPPSASTMYLPPTPSFGQAEIEEGAYINAEFQVTTTATANAAHYGNIRRCVYSNAAEIVAGTRYHKLTFDAAFDATLAVDDVVESVLPLPDEHTRLLVVETAKMCFQKKGNANGLKLIGPELTAETAKFMAYANTPRDSKGPTYIRRSLRERPPRFVDGRAYPGYYW